MAPRRNADELIVVPRDGVRAWLEDVLAALPDLEVRRLFGGAGIYSGEAIFGILHEQRVYLKTSEATRAAFVERGCDALRVRSGSVLTSYYEVPADVLDDEAELLAWARRALEVAGVPPALVRQKKAPRAAAQKVAARAAPRSAAEKKSPRPARKKRRAR